MMTFGELSRRNGQRWPSKDAFVEVGRRVTWGEFDWRTDQLGAALRGLNIAPGERVAMLGHDCIETAEVFIACVKIGVVRVGLNPRLAPREIAALVKDCGASVVFVTAECEGLLKELPPGAKPIIVGIGAGHGQILDYDRLVASQDAGALDHTPGDVAMIAYTTGSTGLPKGAVYPHRAFLQSILMVALCEGIDSRTVWLHTMPAAGVPLMHMLRNIFHAATTVIVGPWNPERALHLIQAERTTNTVLVPTMLNSLLACPDLARTDVSSMKLLGYGASTLPAATIRKAMETFGCPFLQMYGTTELMGMSMMLYPEDHAAGIDSKPQVLTSTGKPLPWVDVKVVDEEGRVVPVGEPGELVIRSDFRFKEYWRNPQQTEEVLRDDWIYTGDIGRIDADGYVYLNDRAKFKIKTGGYLVYPTEVENVLAEHEAVDEVAVVGIPDLQWGDRIEAAITLKPGAHVDEEAMRAFCKDRIASFKVPKHVAIWPQMPKGPTGKIQKLVVIEQLSAESLQRGAR